jgi:nucleotide-binding universal stress UspA family protein
MNGRHVLVGVDGSEESLRAVRWAAAEARSRHIPLRLVHGFEAPDAPYLADPAVRITYRKGMTRRAHRWLREAADQARGVDPELVVEVELRLEHPVPLLARDSAAAALLVLGSRGQSGLGGPLLGSVAIGVCARARCPVVAVPHPAALAVAAAPIVVGVDGSPLSEPALAFAFDFAASHGAPLVAVHTWWDDYLDRRFSPPMPYPETVEVEAHEVLAERLAGWQEKVPEVTVHRVVEASAPAKTLLRESGEARLLVVGSRGRGGFAGWLLGSTSRTLLHRATCPVAVVRSDEAVMADPVQPGDR